FAGQTIFVFARSLMPGLGKILIAPPAASAFRDKNALGRGGEVGDDLVVGGVENQSPNRNLQNHVLAGMARAVRALAMTAAVGLEFAIIAIAQQRVVVGVRFEIDAAAVAAVSARWSAARYIFFAAKGHAAVAPIAGFHKNFGFINKHSSPALLSRNFCSVKAQDRFDFPPRKTITWVLRSV